MRTFCAAAVALVLAACSKPSPPPANVSRGTVAPPKITQFYSTTPQLAKGEKATICYGVENSTTVWISPPRRELSAALSRCIEAEPKETTTYTLVAEGAGGSARQELTISMGPPRVKIVEVRVSALEIAAGTPVSICYKVEHAASVRIEPNLPPSSSSPACAVASPQRTTTYTVTAVGAGGERDQEHVTVKVH